jgi:hypothetical protein
VRGEYAAMLLGEPLTGGTAAVQRRVTASQDEPSPDEDKKIGPTPPLPAKERAILIENAKLNVVAAYSSFLAACEHNRAAVREAAKKRAEVWNFLAETALGFMVPGLMKGIAAIVEKLPVHAPEWVYALALKFQQREYAKALASSVTKAALIPIKSDIALLTTDTDSDAFLSNLEDEFDVAFKNVRESLDARSVEEIAAVYAAFAPEVTNKSTYTIQIRDMVKAFQQLEGGRFGDEVEKRQGKAGGEWTYEWTATRMVVQVGARLAVVEEENGRFPGGGSWEAKRMYKVLAWVPEGMEQMAKDKAADDGQVIPTIDHDELLVGGE